jgi:hypothetical protein
LKNYFLTIDFYPLPTLKNKSWQRVLNTGYSGIIKKVPLRVEGEKTYCLGGNLKSTNQ